MNGTTQKSITAILILLILGAIVYEFYFSVSAPPPLSDQTVGTDVITLAAQVGNISFDSSLFTSETFVHLKDRSVPLTPETQGRVNPFATIGSD